MERRQFMSRAVMAIGAVPGVLVGIPAIIYLAAQARRPSRAETWRDLGELQNFPVGQMQRAEIKLAEDDWTDALNVRSVYVWRRDDENFIVFSRSCTDLGCPVKWDAGSEWFFCPCHGAIFSKEGEPQAGPPKKALYRYATRIRNGILQVDARSVPPKI